MKKSILKLHIPFQSPELRDAELILETLLDCLEYGDDQALRDVLTVYTITACNLESKKNLITHKARKLS